MITEYILCSYIVITINSNMTGGGVVQHRYIYVYYVYYEWDEWDLGIIYGILRVRPSYYMYPLGDN